MLVKDGYKREKYALLCVKAIRVRIWEAFSKYNCQSWMRPPPPPPFSHKTLRMVTRRLILLGKKFHYHHGIFMLTLPFCLKGLSHEIDFKNVVKNGQILALIRAAAGFLIFRRLLWFLDEINISVPVNAKITPLTCVLRLTLYLNFRQACQCCFMGNQSEARLFCVSQ